MAKYAPAQPVETIAKDLIAKVHTHLKTVRLRYVFVDVARKSNGDPVPATTKKISGLHAFLTRPPDSSSPEPLEPNPYFVIEVGKDIWEDYLTEHQRVALVDHHLSRCGVDHTEDGEPRIFVRDPDVMEFTGVLIRQGAWTDALHGFAKEAKQMSLDLDEAIASGELRPDADEEEGEE